MLRTHCGEYGRLRTWNIYIYNAGKTLYKDRNRVKDFFFHLENKQQTMPNNAETQVKIMYS